MRRLYLHIGQPKTASTFLQKEVFPALSNLDLCLLPRAPGYKSRDSRRTGDGRLAEQITARSPLLWRERRDELAPIILGGADGQSRLVSDEMFFGNFRSHEQVVPHLAAIARLARESFDELRIICLIRRQDTRLISGYIQRSDAKLHAGQADFEAFAASMCDPCDQRYGAGTAWQYGELIGDLIALVGADRLFVRPYEELRAEPRRFLRALLAFLEQPEESARALAATLVEERRRANVRRVRENVWQARPFNRFAEGISRLILLREPRAFWKRRRSPPPLIELRPETSQAILRSYEETNRKAARLLGLDLARYGYF